MALAMPFLAIGFFRPLSHVIASASVNISTIATLAGCGVIVGLAYLFVQRFDLWLMNFLTTLEHELTHAISGLPFGIIPVGIAATGRRGGFTPGIGVLGPLSAMGAPFSALAPYFFPTLSGAAILLIWYFDKLSSGWVAPLIGCTLGYDTFSNVAETIECLWHDGGVHPLSGTEGNDLTFVGALPSLVIIPVLSVICYGAVLSFVFGRTEGVLPYFSNGLQGILEAAQWTLRWMQS